MYYKAKCKTNFPYVSAWKGCYSISFLYESGSISSDKYVAMYEIEYMSLDYCGQMCQKVHDSNFMGVQDTKCYCIDYIYGSLLLSNRACSTKCPGDMAELCGGRGSLSIHQLKNDSFTGMYLFMSLTCYLQCWPKETLQVLFYEAKVTTSDGYTMT